MRICLVVPYDLADEGGVKRHAVHLAESLRRSGDEVTVVGPLSRGAAGEGFFGFGGVMNVPANGAANYMALFTSPWAVRRFFRRRHFDVVHVHEPFVPLLAYYALWLAPEAALVATFHMYAEDEPRVWLWLRRLAARVMRPRVQRAIAVSRPAEAFAAAAWDGPMVVIPNGVPTGIYRPPEPRPDARDGSDPSAPVRLLFVGNWRDARKGLPYLLQAHGRLRAQGLAITLDVIGSGPPGPPPSLPGVTFHGAVSDERRLAEHYRSCDVFVSPATGQESFGIVLLEAMASGRSLVCSDIDGYRDLAGGPGARLVAPGDVDGLASAILALARDPRARGAMGESNRGRAEEYDWQRLAERVRQEYGEALRLRGRPRAEERVGESLEERSVP